MNASRREFVRMGALGLLGLAAPRTFGFVTPSFHVDLNALSDRMEFMRRSEWAFSQPRAARLRLAKR